MPGAVGSSLNQRLILKGLDGIVFVADSSPDRLEENIDCLDSLEDILIGLNKNPSDMPMVFQFNKQDLPGAMPVDKLSSLLNLRKAPQYPSNARGGNGVLPVLKEISKRVLSGLGNIGD